MGERCVGDMVRNTRFADMRRKSIADISFLPGCSFEMMILREISMLDVRRKHS